MKRAGLGVLQIGIKPVCGKAGGVGGGGGKGKSETETERGSRVSFTSH